MHLNNIILDGKNNPTRTVEEIIQLLEYLHPLMHPKPIIRKKKIKRNDPCPCGSNRKYKKCCKLNKQT